MIEALKPKRGGAIRPFDCAWFIREFLLGKSPVGSPPIDPEVGATQTEIHRAYKEALHRAWAEHMVALEEEARMRKGLPTLTPKEAEVLTVHYRERMAYRLTSMRYASFTRYFSHLKRLGYVEETGREEPSIIQDSYPPAPPRRYYRLTEAGRKATEAELADPITRIIGCSAIGFAPPTV